MLIVEHDLDFIKDICDTLTVLDQGLVVDSGPTRAVQNSEKVKEAYLAMPDAMPARSRRPVHLLRNQPGAVRRALKAPSRGAVAILGRNGAGKTTLLKTLAGDLRPARGSVRFDGSEATRMPTELRVRRGIGYVPQEHGVFARLTVKDNLLVGAMSATDGQRRIERGGHAVPAAGPAPGAAGRYSVRRRAQNAGDQPRLARRGRIC